jgi:hypothetical protein
VFKLIFKPETNLIMKKAILIFLSGIIFYSVPSMATRVTHTYADGSQEIYYTDMDCSEVNAWVAQNQEWRDIVSCDPEVMVAPPAGGVITVNSVKVEVPAIKDFSVWVKPSGKPANGYISRIKGNREAGVTQKSSGYLYLLTGIVCLGLGFLAGKFKRS